MPHQVMTSPLVFYTRPGDEMFAPRPAHPGEDAGGDIRVYAPDRPSRFAVDTYNEYCRLAQEAKCRDFLVNGRKVSLYGSAELGELLGGNGGVAIRPGQTVAVETGFVVSLPSRPAPNLLPVFKIVPRSGLAINHGITVANSPGIGDAGYLDWVKCGLFNAGHDFHVFTHGARIAQLLVEFVYDVSISEVKPIGEFMKNTLRGGNGLGSTGVDVV